MSDTCWSVTAGPLNIDKLAKDSRGRRTAVALTELPPTVLLTAKVTFKSIAHGELNRWMPPIQTDLIFGTWRVDRSWCNLMEHDLGAVTVVLHGAIALPPPTTDDIRFFFRYRNRASIRVMPTGVPFEIDNVWLTAVPLTQLIHQGGPYPKPD